MNVAIYELNVYWMLTLAIILLIAAWYGIIVFYSTRQVYGVLRKFKASMSPMTYRKQVVALMSLMAQLAASVLGMFPPTTLALLLIVEFRYAQSKLLSSQSLSQSSYLPATCRFLLAIFSTHASVNACVLVVTTPPYRRFTMFWKNKLV